MIKKVKIRNVTDKQYLDWKTRNCNTSHPCKYCIFSKVLCCLFDEKSWLNNKNLYSDKFLDQTIEIEVPDILTKEEHDYLEAVIKPITKDLKYISLSHGTMPFHYLSFKNKNKLVIGRIDTGIYEYKSIEKDYDYTLEELGL